MKTQRLFRVKIRRLLFCAVVLATLGKTLGAQTQTPDDLAQRIQKLTDALARTQAQLEQSQREMDEMRRQLSALQQQIANRAVPPTTTPSQDATTIEDLRERQAIEETQIATQEQAKVETQSKFPLKLSGLLLFNGFVNTGGVDMAATPTLAIGGPGSTGASVRQTLLGFDARGPHLFGALSHADMRVDFAAIQSPAASGTTGTSGYSSSYSGGSSLLRLRTAHATLDWAHTQAFFSLDRSILNPDSPTSLTATAEPALAWSGNLWVWNPQVGVTHDIALRAGTQLRVQSALIDAADAPLLPSTPVSATQIPTPTANLSEQSRWPGSELRVALMGPKPDTSAHFGLGSYLAPHRNSVGYTFNAWAVTADYRLPLPGRLSLTGSVYRGQALGGLGAGGYKDYLAYVTSDYVYYQVPDDVGGWSQLKEKVNERLEFNAAIGFDELFAGQLRPYAGPYSAMYQNLARNRTFTGNVIYSPSSYLIFSLEFRHLESSPVVGESETSNIIGLGAGYKF